MSAKVYFWVGGGLSIAAGTLIALYPEREVIWFAFTAGVAMVTYGLGLHRGAKVKSEAPTRSVLTAEEVEPHERAIMFRKPKVSASGTTPKAELSTPLHAPFKDGREYTTHTVEQMLKLRDGRTYAEVDEAFRTRYRGKWLRISGTVSNVSKPAKQWTTIHLNEHIAIRFRGAAQEHAASMKIGEAVTIEGEMVELSLGTIWLDSGEFL